MSLAAWAAAHAGGVAGAASAPLANCLPARYRASDLTLMTTTPHPLLAEAVAAHRQGQLPRAFELYRRVLAVSPNDSDALHLMGVALGQAGRQTEARPLIERALALAPDNAEIVYNLGNIEREEGKFPAAAALYRRALALQPAHLQALNNLGATLQALGDLAGAEWAFRATIAHSPTYARGWSALASLLREMGRAGEAEAAAETALHHNPQQVIAHVTLGSLRKDRGDVAGAIEAYRRAIALDPKQERARAFLCHQLQHGCQWAEAEALCAEVETDSRLALAAGAAPAEPIMSAVARGAPPDLVKAMAEMQAEAAAARVQPLAPASLRGEGRLRIGYLSADLHDHATGHLIRRLFALHDRRAFSVHAYSYGPDDGSFWRRSLVEGADAFVEIGGLDHRAAAERIRADGIDLLVDLKGHTQQNRLGILAYRPAPIQATWLGFPGPVGRRLVDYAIVDRIVMPPALAAAELSEAPAYLPGCYQMTDDAQPIAAPPQSRAQLELPEEGFVFASFNQSYKIERALFECWLRLLRQTPGARLWLWRSNALAAETLRKTATAAGVDPARLVFAERLAKPQHLARLAAADLALDCWTVNGHTTTTDCLWAGLPVLAMQGTSFVGRVSASLLEACGLPELIAMDAAAYETKALGLARDPAALAEVRTKLADLRKSSALFDSAGFVRGLEALYRAMAARRRAGLPPAPLTDLIDGATTAPA